MQSYIPLVRGSCISLRRSRPMRSTSERVLHYSTVYMSSLTSPWKTLPSRIARGLFRRVLRTAVQGRSFGNAIPASVGNRRHTVSALRITRDVTGS